MPLRPLLVLCLAGICIAADDHDKPLPPLPPPKAKTATNPATSVPARVRDSLVNGSVRYLVPREWERLGRADEDKQAQYRISEDFGIVAILVTQQDAAVPHANPGLRKQLTEYCLAKVEEDLKDRGAKVIQPATVEKDDRFMARVRVRFKDGSKAFDVTHFYRGLGINLLSVTSTAHTNDPNEAKEVHDASGLMILSVTLGPPNPKPKK